MDEHRRRRLANRSQLDRAPTTGLAATFSTPGTFTVTLSGDAAPFNRMDVQFTGASALVLDLNGHLLDTESTSGTFGSQGFTYGYNAGANSGTAVTLESSQAGGVLKVNQIHTGRWGRSTDLTMKGANLLVNLDGAGINYLLGGDGRFTLKEGVKVTSTGSFRLSEGTTVQSPASTWLITDPGTAVTNRFVGSAATPSLLVGKTGTNTPTMIISNGAAYYGTTYAYVAQGGDATANMNMNANGKLIVTGVGSVFTNNALYISAVAGNGTLTKAGYTGTGGGFMIVEKGGVVTNGPTTIGGGAYSATVTNALAYGELIIRDTGSVYRATDWQRVGLSCQGAIHVRNGGQYLVGGNASSSISLGRPVVGTFISNTNAYGLLSVSNAGSYVVANNVFVGGEVVNGVYGYGDVVVADNALLKATNSIILHPRSGLTVSDARVEAASLTLDAGTTLRIELGARNPADAYVQLSAVLSVASNVRLELDVLKNFAAAPNTLVTLTTQSSRTGTYANLTNGDVVEVGQTRFQYIETSGSSSLRVLPPRGTAIIIR